jgi:hypothetical protein
MTRPDFDTLDLPPDPPSSGEPVMVFYDSEFTAISPDADLLSIGFAASDSDAELYIEIEDADLATASLFVREAVLPLFGRHNPEVLTRDAAAARIEAWFDGLREGDRQRQIVLVSDSPMDWQLFIELFVTMPGKPPWTSEINVVGRMVQHLLGSGRQQAAFAEALEIYFRQHKGRHHALVDARALKSAYWESRFS